MAALPLEISFYNRLPMQTVTIGVIRVCDIYVQKSSLPTVAWGAKKIDSSPAKEEKTTGDTDGEPRRESTQQQQLERFKS